MKQLLARMQAERAEIARQCPWPDKLAYPHTQAVADPERKLPPFKTLYPQWLEGCAILTFTLDDDGNPMRLIVASASSPPFGAFALRLLERDEYATTAPAGTRYQMLIATRREKTGYSVLQASR